MPCGPTRRTTNKRSARPRKKRAPRSDPFNELYLRTWRDRARYAGPEALGQEGPQALMRLPWLMEEILDFWNSAKKRPQFKAEYIITHNIRASLEAAARAAAQAGMSEAQFGDFVMRAMFLDRPDPVAAWGEVRAMQTRIIERLSRADVVRIEAPGTDLTLGLPAGHIWESARITSTHGVAYVANLPTEEVFSMPDRNSLVHSDQRLVMGNGLPVSTAYVNARIL